MKKVIRITAITLLILTGINALVAGALFIIEPSGAIMGMSVDYIKNSPFHSFLIPGIVLFIVNGALNIAAAIAAIRNSSTSGKFMTLQGILLSG